MQRSGFPRTGFYSGPGLETEPPKDGAAHMCPCFGIFLLCFLFPVPQHYLLLFAQPLGQRLACVAYITTSNYQLPANLLHPPPPAELAVLVSCMGIYGMVYGVWGMGYGVWDWGLGMGVGMGGRDKTRQR